ncbi:MAG: hypothetical protein NZL96_01345 [Patescibacteria group bacterium]|nr:hypothetical protein [Patescibacteria group bacterium]
MYLFQIQATNFARFSQITSNSVLGLVLKINEYRNHCLDFSPQLLCYLIANKITFFVREFFFRYLKLFSTDYLFISGDFELKYLNVDQFGLLPFIFIPFYVAFWIVLIDKLIKRKIGHLEKLITFSLIITPIPNLLVSDPQKVRLSPMIPFLILALVIGFNFFLGIIRSEIRKWVYITTYLVSSIYFVFFSVSLFVHFNKYEINYYSHVRRLIEFMIQKPESEFFIRNYPELPIIYAFYSKLNPTIDQKEAKRKKRDQLGAFHIEKIRNVNMTEKKIEEIYCQLKNKNLLSNKNYIYAINENLIDNQKISKAEKIIFSKDTSLQLIFVYSLNEINSQFISCLPD